MPEEPTRLLKANAIRGLGSKVVFNFEDLRKNCDDYIEQVRKEAQRLIHDARQKAVTIQSHAYEEGHKSGLNQGLRDAEKQIESRSQELADEMAVKKLKTTIPAMQAAVDVLVQERDRWLAEWEQTAVRLSLAVAEKLIRRKIQADETLAIEMIRGVLELAAGTPRIILRLNPGDLENLGDHAEEVVRGMTSCGETTLVPDQTISPGGCVIQTQHGIIDADIDTQLERIATELLE